MENRLGIDLKRAKWWSICQRILVGDFYSLELLMRIQVHGRKLHRDFARYLGSGSSVACFHYDHIAPNTVLMPSQQISYDARAQQQWLVGEIEQLIEVPPLPPPPHPPGRAGAFLPTPPSPLPLPPRFPTSEGLCKSYEVPYWIQGNPYLSLYVTMQLPHHNRAATPQ